MLTPEQLAEFKRQKAMEADSIAAEYERQKQESLDYMMLSDEDKNRAAYREAFDEASGFDQFLAGVGKVPMQLEAGMMNILGLGSDEYKQEVEQALPMLEEIHGPGTAGEITGDIALTMLPAGRVAKTVQTAGKTLPRLAQGGATLAAESALLAGYEGLKAPETGETRLDNIEDTFKWSMILGAPFAALRGAKVPVSDEAQKMLDQNIDITPGMAGPVRANVEKFMSNIPFLGNKTKAMQDRTIKQWNVELLNKATPKLPGVTPLRVMEPGHKGFRIVQDEFSELYKGLWKGIKKEHIRPRNFSIGLNKAKSMQDLLPDGNLNAAKQAAKRVEKDFNKFKQTANGEILSTLDKSLRTLSRSADDPLTTEYYDALREAVRSGINPSAIEDLRRLDGSYRDFAILMKAGSGVKAQERGAIFTPRELESAVKVKNTPYKTTRGMGDMQDEAAEATGSIANVLEGRSEVSPAEVLGRWGTIAGVVGTGGVAAVPIGLTRVGALNETMRKYLTGTPIWSGNAAENIARFLRLMGVNSIDEVNDPEIREALRQEEAALQ